MKDRVSNQMSLEWISQPLNEASPAGDDLFETDDAAYGDYYFGAVGRLPEPGDYFRPGMEIGGNKQPDVIFDPKSVALGEELAAIDGLLKRSRDLRLLVLRAQWAMLAGDLETTVESVEATAALLEALPDAAHPKLVDGPRDRLDALNDLTQVGAMILPLRYLNLAGSGTSLRKILVTKGRYTPHDGEHDLMLDPLLKMLAEAGDEFDVVRGLIKRFFAALEQIEMACLSSDTPHKPQLRSLKDELTEILALLAEARPDLDQLDGDSDEVSGCELEVPPYAAAQASHAGHIEGGSVWVAPVTEVQSHDEARERLKAVENYFTLREPSSAALLLVTQARLLIGKSLIDAFEELMPNAVDRAVVEFTSAFDFKLARGQLRSLADHADIGAEEVADSGHSDTASGGGGIETPDLSPATFGNFKVNNPEDAKSQIAAVENFFRSVEKSSPIPLLLARAKGYIGKDFEFLMREFIPSDY
ncbi:type VI secretion system ImpA family N-terminal domain-containing protein [Tritonibacter litoralis]|uniref:type VI secretion system ImpA family N-terminal domain-containing protein n=1 Tax=Tritonibacter litoralis TaxID=2662264 RepID=UPI00188557BD